MRAGADRVISPYKSSGAEMARMALHPQVGGVLEFEDLRMEEIVVTPPCEGEGKTIEAVRGQSVIVALRRQGGRLEAQPAPQTVIGAGDMLVALGPADALERLGGSSSRRADERLRTVRHRGSTPPCVRPPRRCAAAMASWSSRCGPSAPGARGQGDYSTNAAMLLAPVLHEPPRKVAERIGEELWRGWERISSGLRSPVPGS